MKTLLMLLIPVALIAQVNPKSERTRNYTKRNGTHVQSYRRTVPNKTQRDNYSSKGNTNPNTGRKGYRKPKK